MLLPVWNPELAKDIRKLENTQKIALRVCTKQYSIPYTDLSDRELSRAQA